MGLMKMLKKMAADMPAMKPVVATLEEQLTNLKRVVPGAREGNLKAMATNAKNTKPTRSQIDREIKRYEKEQQMIKDAYNPDAGRTLDINFEKKGDPFAALKEEAAKKSQPAPPKTPPKVPPTNTPNPGSLGGTGTGPMLGRPLW